MDKRKANKPVIGRGKHDRTKIFLNYGSKGKYVRKRRAEARGVFKPYCFSQDVTVHECARKSTHKPKHY